MKTISVKAASSKGIAIGRVFILNKPDLTPAAYRTDPGHTKDEVNKFEQAAIQAALKIDRLAAGSDIFKAHSMLVRDAELKSKVCDRIQKGINAEQALSEVISDYAAELESQGGEYLKERTADLKDIGYRILKIMKALEDNPITRIKEEVILVADELLPSDIMDIDLHCIKGFITQSGGAAGHVSILAENRGLPALVGVDGILRQVGNGDIIIMDIGAGKIIINPEEAILDEYIRLRSQSLKELQHNEGIRKLPAITLDGKAVRLCANAGSIDEVRQVAEAGIENIGLFRSEFLFMESRHFPTEEEQFGVYKTAAEICSGEVIIRTLDIGGDKKLPYYHFDQEDNPSLGLRGIRLLLELKEVFKTQLRAILRAGLYGKVKICFPMVVSVEEFMQAKVLLEQCKDELKKNNIPFNGDIETGMMVETPAAVMNIEDFTQLSDFFSIGTNDLTQYMLAADRGNQKLSVYHNYYHPAVLRSVHKVITAAHKWNKRVGMCGEMAGDPKAAALLLGMGLEEFSMPVSAIAAVKDAIRNTDHYKAELLAGRILRTSKLEDILTIVSSKQLGK